MSEAPDPSPSPSPSDLGAPPAAAVEALGESAIARLAAYGQILADAGVVRGMIGPREVPRLWERHLLNCAAVAEQIPPQAHVVDVGSGAGLPGLVLALVREDLRLTLIEPLQRRCDFLRETVGQLELSSRVEVLRSSADQVRPAEADIVTARAVAALDSLAPWCLRHAKVGGTMLAMKGQRAAEELTAARPVLQRWGAGAGATIVYCGGAWLETPVALVRAIRQR